MNQPNYDIMRNPEPPQRTLYQRQMRVLATGAQFGNPGDDLYNLKKALWLTMDAIGIPATMSILAIFTDEPAHEQIEILSACAV